LIIKPPRTKGHTVPTNPNKAPAKPKDTTVTIDKAEHDKLRTELVNTRNENATLRERAKAAEEKAAEATRAKASVDRALKDARQQLNDAAAEVRELGTPLIATEDGEVYLVLKKAMHLGDGVKPMGTPVARFVLMNGASLNYVVDSVRSGFVTEKAPTGVGGGKGSGIRD
jgi:hypothetical protein